MYKFGKPILDEEVKFRKLGKLADLRNIDEKNSNDTLLIGTCKNCNSKLVYYNHDIEDFEGEIYVEIDNIKDIVLQEYLYEYLNSKIGMDELLSRKIEYLGVNHDEGANLVFRTPSTSRKI